MDGQVCYGELGFPDRSIGSLFEEQAFRHPEKTVLWHRDRSVSYRALNRASNRLAAQLLHSGLKRGDVVAVKMGRTPNFVTALLAIVKAGGAYLAVDPRWPEPRIQTAFQTAGVFLFITDPHNAPAEDIGFDTLVIDHELAVDFTGVPADDAAPDVETGLEDIAYVNFTSGSSGTPKGVIMPHRGVVSLVFNQNYVSLSSETVTLQLASPSFDVMAFEVWSALLHGGTCVLFDGTLPSLNRLRAIINDYGVDTVLLATTLFNMVMDNAPDIVKPLKTLLTGGEAQSLHHFKIAKRALPDLTIVNAYGPTEACVFATWFPISAFRLDDTAVPIGMELRHREVIIIRPDLSFVEPGEVGEICVAGPGVALGYIGRPDLTEERFVQMKFPNGRIKTVYRTGDLGKLNDEGMINYLGRADQQVKLNGFRIELEEIENALAAHPGISQAIVLVHGQGVKRNLKAVLVAPLGMPSDIKTFLERTLPDYMIPADYKIVDQLPLNISGKVDRPALISLF